MYNNSEDNISPEKVQLYKSREDVIENQQNISINSIHLKPKNDKNTQEV